MFDADSKHFEFLRDAQSFLVEGGQVRDMGGLCWVGLFRVRVCVLSMGGVGRAASLCTRGQVR
jgi:hypothetical protein